MVGGAVSGAVVCEKGAAVTKPALKCLNTGKYLRIGGGRHQGRKVLRVAGKSVEWLETAGIKKSKTEDILIYGIWENGND